MDTSRLFQTPSVVTGEMVWDQDEVSPSGFNWREMIPTYRLIAVPTPDRRCGRTS